MIFIVASQLGVGRQVPLYLSSTIHNWSATPLVQAVVGYERLDGWQWTVGTMLSAGILQGHVYRHAFGRMNWLVSQATITVSPFIPPPTRMMTQHYAAAGDSAEEIAELVPSEERRPSRYPPKPPPKIIGYAVAAVAPLRFEVEAYGEARYYARAVAEYAPACRVRGYQMVQGRAAVGWQSSYEFTAGKLVIAKAEFEITYRPQVQGRSHTLVKGGWCVQPEYREQVLTGEGVVDHALVHVLAMEESAWLLTEVFG